MNQHIRYLVSGIGLIAFAGILVFISKFLGSDGIIPFLFFAACIAGMGIFLVYKFGVQDAKGYPAEFEKITIGRLYYVLKVVGGTGQVLLAENARDKTYPRLFQGMGVSLKTEDEGKYVSWVLDPTGEVVSHVIKSNDHVN